MFSKKVNKFVIFIRIIVDKFILIVYYISVVLRNFYERVNGHRLHGRLSTVNGVITDKRLVLPFCLTCVICVIYKGVEKYV